MSVGLFKYDGDLYDRNSKEILSEPVASERMYMKYLGPAIEELNIQYFYDGAWLRKCNLDSIMSELDMLIQWVEVHVEGIDREYFLERLENMKVVIPRELENDDDILYIF